MCCYFFVIKLLMLKILLAGLTALITASPYDYAYHPSAEEFDNILRETRRTWTYNILKADRDRLLIKPLSLHKADLFAKPLQQQQQQATTEARYFVPKFQYENEAKKFNSFANSQHIQLQQQASSSSNSNNQVQLPIKNIGSTLDFNFFSDELPKPIFNAEKEQTPTSTTATTPTTLQAYSNFAEINIKPIAKPKNTTQDNFPIYFTNPATGIVYAITEVGITEENLTRTNGSIPIFITKEQYERDIDHLKQEFEQKCPQTKLATLPQIHKKPLAFVLPITSTRFSPPSTPPLKKPSPVVVKAELTVKDKKPTSSLRPLRKKKKKSKSKHKLKKHNRPGHKTPVGTTLRPILASQPDGPVIVMGSRVTTTMKPFLNNEKLSTQLEKPNFDNIFSSATAPHAAYQQGGGLLDPLLFKTNHQIEKRSPKQREYETSLIYNQFSSGFQKDNTEQNEKKNSLKNGSKFKGTNHKKKYKHFNTLISLKNHKNTQKFRKFQKGNTVLIKENLKPLQNIKMPENIQKNSELKRYFGSNSMTKVTLLSDKMTEVLNVREVGTHSINMNNFNTNYSSGKSKNILSNKTFNKSKQNYPNNFKKNLSAIFQTKLKLSESQNDNNNNNLKRSVKISPKYLDQSNYQIKKNKHHLSKRSVNNLKPKFIKKFNTTILQTDVKQNASEIEIQNSERNVSENKQIVRDQLENFKSSNKTKQVEQNLGLKKRKRKSKIQTNPINATKANNLATIRANAKKCKTLKNIEKKSNRQQEEADYYFFADYDDEGEEDDEEEEDDENYEDDDDEEENDDKVDNHNEIVAYDDDNDDIEPPLPASEVVSVSVDDSTEQPITQKTKSSPEEEDNDSNSSAIQIEHIKLTAPAPALLDYYNINKLKLKSKESSTSSPSSSSVTAASSFYKKRIHRRPQLKIDRDDYDYDEEEEDNSITSNLGGFFRMIFYPIQVVMGSVMDSLAAKDNEEEEDPTTFNPYTQYTSYHNTLKQQTSDEYDNDYDSDESFGSSLSSWLSSWFGFNRRNKKIGSTTVAPVKPKPTKSNSWLPSWLGFGNNDRISTESAASNEDSNDEYDKWFASWFGETKPKARKRTTTTTSTTTQIPQVPILTIVDPMKNPQNWIGILAHHIINHTSTSTVNPLKDIWSKVTTTTENPEIPRKVSYDKYQIWRLKPQDESQVKALEEYKKSEDGIKLQWLKGPSLRGLTDVLVPPKMLVDFQASLTFELIDHEVLIFDVGKAIAYEKAKEDYFFTTTTTQKPKKNKNKPPSQSAGMTWHKYYEYDDIIKYLESMRMRFPHLVELIHIGRSYEGRPLIVTKIESKEAAAVNSAHYTAHQRNKLRHKKRIGLANAVFIEAGTHGMEWIAPATATWIMNELLKIMKKNVSDDQSFIRNTTWYIMPVLNPDGYVYSHEYDRFWKKSRSRHISRPSGILNSAMTWLQKKRTKEKVCFGVDLDRNWHYQWGRRSSSKSPCNEFYAGPTPFSEPETKALSEFLMDYRTQIKLFISMQAYGQIISYPYKANTTYDTERLDDLLDVAMVGTDGLRKKGSKSRYKIDSSNDLVENRSGCSDAFAAYEVGIPFSYTLQLADNGVHGYLLPSASIESTAKDAFEIITGMLDYI